MSILDKIAKFCLSLGIVGCLVFLITSYGFSQVPKVQGAPTSYSIARTDTNTQLLTTPLPAWGPTGTSKKYCNPNYKNICIIRLTDSTTFNNKASGLSVEDGKENPFSKDIRFIMVSAANGSSRIITFNPKTETVGVTPTVFKNGPAEFSYNAVNTAFQRQNKTQVYKLVSKDNWTTYTSTLVYDFINCLPSGYNPTWVSSWNVSHSDTSFVSIYSNNGGQGSGGNVVAYKKGVGCSTLNTLTGQVTDFTGKPLGTYDDGVKPLADRFVVHDGGTATNPGVMNIGYSVNDNTQGAHGSGCKAGACADNTPYFWEIGTTHLRPCGPYQCGGHGDSGFNHYADGKKLRLHLLLNPAQPLLQLANLPCCGYDFQGSWNNTDGSDNQPMAGITAFVTKTKAPPFTGPYQNEIFMVAPDGSKVWRMGQTFGSGTSPYYICQNTHMAVSPDGHWSLFSSDMGGNGALGYEADGVTSRCDAFLMELK
jgi:hypothetical protein